MSSSSAIADAAFPMPGARGEARDQMAAPEPAAYVDSGQPVADLPPLIEPTLEPFGPRPPRPPPPPPQLSGPARAAGRADPGGHAARSSDTGRAGCGACRAGTRGGAVIAAAAMVGGGSGDAAARLAI